MSKKVPQIHQAYLYNKNILNNEEIKNLIICNFCSGLLCEPHICSECHQSFCFECIQISCPSGCNNSIFKKIDYLENTLLSQIKIFCPNCDDKIFIKDFKTHKDKCLKIKCFNCESECPINSLKLPDETNNKHKFSLIKPIKPDNTDIFGNKLVFKIFCESAKIKGFIIYNNQNGGLEVGYNQYLANYFNFLWIKKHMYLKIYIKNKKSWFFIQPDKNIKITKTPKGSIYFDIKSGALFSKLSDNNENLLTMQIWNHLLFFYTGDPDLYSPVVLKLIYPEKSYNTQFQDICSFN